MGSYAARFAVGGSDAAGHGNGFHLAGGFVAAGDAACKASAGIQGAVAAGTMHANVDTSAVTARDAARVLVDYLDRTRLVGGVLDQALVAACHAAALGGGSDRCAVFHRDSNAAVAVFLANGRPLGIESRHTAGLGGAADFDRHALGGDGAQVIACHAAGGGDAVDVAIGIFQRNNAGFAIVTGHTADVQPAADAAAFCRGGVGDGAVVDARDAAQVAVALLLVAHGVDHAAVGDGAVVDTGQAARGHGVLHAAEVYAVLQLGFGRGAADDAARKVAVVVGVQLAQRDTAVQDIGPAVGRVSPGAEGQAAVGLCMALVAVAGVFQREGGVGCVVADDAAHVGVGVNVELVAQARQGDGTAARVQRRLVEGVAAAELGQQGLQVGRDGAVLVLQGVFQRICVDYAVVADDAAHHAVGHDASGADGGGVGRRAAGVDKFEFLRGQVGADDAAHKVDALDAVGADLHGGQAGRAVQADDAAHAVAGGHDGAGDAEASGLAVCDGGGGVVVARHAADKAAAVQHRAQGRALVGPGLPADLTVGAVAAGHAAHEIGIAGGAVPGLAQLLQQRNFVFICYLNSRHAVDAVHQFGGLVFGEGRAVLLAPGSIVDARNAAHVGRIGAQARHQALVGHIFDGAVQAVDRDDAAHVTVAEHIAVVGAAAGVQVAAHKTADKAAHEAAAQHIAGLGVAVGHLDVAAKAHQAADKVALEGAVLVQRTVGVIARLHEVGQGRLAQAAAGGAVALIQYKVARIARNAAEELAQHTALARGTALVVGPGQHGTLVGQAGQGVGVAAVPGGGVQVARDAAHEGIAHHGGLVGDVLEVFGVLGAGQVGGVQHTGHAAHAHGAPEGLALVFVGDGVIARFFRCIGAGVGIRTTVVGGVLILEDARHGDVLVQRQVGELGAGFGHGKADEPADAVGFVFVRGAVHPVHADGRAAEGQHSGDLGLSAAAAAAVDGAVGQAAGVHARQRAHRPDLGAVVGVGIGQGLQVLGAVGIHRHGGVGGLLACCFYLGVDLHIGVAQGDIFQCTVIFTHQAYVVVAGLVVRRGMVPLFGSDRAAPQLQVADDHLPAAAAAGEGDVLADGGDGGPGHDPAGAAGHLGHRLRVLLLGRAVDGDAAVGPIQGGVFTRKGIFAAVYPAQVVQVAEVFQRAAACIAACGKQCIFGIGLLRFAFGIKILKVRVRTCFHLNVNIFRNIVRQAGDAEQGGLGGAQVGTVIFGGAQQVGVAHGVQRQDKAALAVAEGEGVVLVRFVPAVVRRVGPVHLDLGVVVGGVGKDAAPLDLQLKEGLIGRCIVEFSVINGVDVAVFAVAAPV